MSVKEHFEDTPSQTLRKMQRVIVLLYAIRLTIL